MRLCTLKLKNFRCFGNIETVLDIDNITLLIGANSSGKSAVLQALTKLFGNSPSVRQLSRSDFHVADNINPYQISSQSLYIEAVLDFPELKEEQIDSNSPSYTVPPFFQQLTVQSPGSPPYVRWRLEAEWQRGSNPEGVIEQKHIFLSIPDDESAASREYQTPCSAHHFAQIEVIYVPAVRNPSVQLRTSSSAILGRVLSGINWPENIDTDVRDITQTIDGLIGSVSGFTTLQDAMKAQWKKMHSDPRYNDLKVGLTGNDLGSLLKNLEVSFFPTEVERDYQIDMLGEGHRSLFYLSMVRALLDIQEFVVKEKEQLRKSLESPFSETETDEITPIFREDFVPPQLTVLAIEEPENHISPQLLGRLMSNLEATAEKKTVQVVVTSHTPAIVQRIPVESLRHLRVCNQTRRSLVHKIKLPSKSDKAYKFVKEAVQAYPELYFASLVILGEGDTEKIILNRILQTGELRPDSSNMSIVPLGGRHVNHFWRLLTDLDIPFITLLDLDIGREHGGWARIKYVINQLVKIDHPTDKLYENFSTVGVQIDSKILDQMHKWEIDRQKIKLCAELLRKYNVFFIAPLDMDFLMLTAFPTEYQSIGQGPRLSLESAIKSTLKSESAIGKNYSDDEKELMRWYVYLFLNRGKPSTHILALSEIGREALLSNIPSELQAVLDRIPEFLSTPTLTKKMPV